MNDIHDEELVARLERLGAVTPTAAATDHALERVRQALASSPAAERPARRWVLPSYWAAIAAMLLVAAGLTGWLLPPLSTGRAWADVQAAMKAARSVTFRAIMGVPGDPDYLVRNCSFLDNGLCRVEEANGTYYLADISKSRLLNVDPARRTATFIQGVNNLAPAMNMYKFMMELPGDTTARTLPDKKIDGRDAMGFVVKVQGQDWTVWANSRTRLPVRIEIEGMNWEGTKSKQIMDEFAFDKEPNLKLFSLEPPAGYEFISLGVAELPAAPNDADLLKPTVTPLVGIGPAKFGMSLADVEKLLGKPDQVHEAGKYGDPDRISVAYWSRGYELRISKSLGLVSISCNAQASALIKIRDFAGQTDKGIALGAKVADIIRVYGEPDAHEGSTHLSYRRLGADFTLLNGRLVKMVFKHQRSAE
jgi:hypothetical protein